MIRTFIRGALGALVVALAGCGGSTSTCVDVAGGNACSGGGGGGGNATPAASELVIVLSAPSVASDGSETVIATVTALNANRNAVAGVPVTVSVDNGGVVTVSGATTDGSGIVTGAVGIGSDSSNRTITVTARSGSLTASVPLLVTSTGGSVSPSDLILTLSSPTIVNTGAETVTATATALDARRNVLPDTGVTITVNNNATAQPSGTVTNEAGVVTAAVGIGADRTNRTITVTATAGGLTRTATLAVTDTPAVVGPVAADLTLALSTARVTNSGAETVTATATAVDANRNALPGIPVTMRVDASAVVSVSGATTNAQGIVTGVVGIGADRSNRVVTVTATSGSLTRSESFVVNGAEILSSLATLVETNSAGNQIEYTLVDTTSVPMANQSVTVTSPSLPTQSGLTDVNGKYVYTYTAPAVEGDIVISATAAGDSKSDTVQVRPPGGGSVPDAVALPQSASLTPSPSVIAVNTEGSTTNQVELRALFVGTNNTPIKNVRARFDLAGNVNNTDGVITWLGGTYAHSDPSGISRGTFTPGQRSSPTGGVTVRVCYDRVDFPVNACPYSVTSTLTVTSEALAVNIRTNEFIKDGAADLTYIKEFVVMVVDAAGIAKGGVQITPSVDLTGYHKGFYYFDALADRWIQVRTLALDQKYAWNGTTWATTGSSGQPVCPNEDVNRNGIREVGEDHNSNAELDPRKSDVAIKMVGSAVTDSNGLAVLQIEYGRDLATWVDFIITVTASGISGTEARAKYVGSMYGLGNLPAPGSAVTNEDVFPAFGISPYGRGSYTGDFTGISFNPTGVCTNTQ